MFGIKMPTDEQLKEWRKQRDNWYENLLKKLPLDIHDSLPGQVKVAKRNNTGPVMIASLYVPHGVVFCTDTKYLTWGEAQSIVKAVGKVVRDLRFHFWTQVTAKGDNFGNKGGTENLVLYASWVREDKNKRLLTQEEYLRFCEKLRDQDEKNSEALSSRKEPLSQLDIAKRAGKMTWSDDLGWCPEDQNPRRSGR